MDSLVLLMALTGLVLISAGLPVLVVRLFQDAFQSTAPSSVEGLEHRVVLCDYGPRGEVLVDELTERGGRVRDHRPRGPLDRRCRR